jgi:hypothetical protein
MDGNLLAEIRSSTGWVRCGPALGHSLPGTQCYAKFGSQWVGCEAGSCVAARKQGDGECPGSRTLEMVDRRLNEDNEGATRSCREFTGYFRFGLVGPLLF